MHKHAFRDIHLYVTTNVEIDNKKSEQNVKIRKEIGNRLCGINANDFKLQLQYKYA